MIDMGFRTLEISHAAEIHIKEGQLEVTTEEGIALIPIEDLNQIMVHGANIRLSTMDLSILSQNKVALMTLDEKYLNLWVQIIKQKISNQSRALSIMGLEGAEKIAEYAASVNEESVDYNESLAAKDYFAFYHEGFNRTISRYCGFGGTRKYWFEYKIVKNRKKRNSTCAA